MKFLLRGLILLVISATASAGNAGEMRLAVTSSFNNSGLSDFLLPEAKKDLGFDIHLLVVGTGQALKLGESGDVDAVLVHSRKAEDAFVAEGSGTHRREIMYNDFVLVGPRDDPANIASEKNAVGAMQKLSAAKALFVSRGDDSGTHKREQFLWQLSGIDVGSFDSTWYRAAGAGMGAALNIASGMNAYVLSDRASWLKFANKGDLELLFSGDQILFNPYAYLPVNPEKHPHVKHDLALKLEAWLTGEKGQKMIGEYTLDGEAPFTPSAETK